MLLPRAASGVAIGALLDGLEAVECHSLMVVHRGEVVAEGWWAPYSADRLQLLYSLTKTFTAMAVGMVVDEGLLSLDDRVVDVLPEHVPDGLSEQGRGLTVHHLLTMTTGQAVDSLEEAWQLEPGDLVKGFLRVPFAGPSGERHVYDNSTTFVLARMVERVTGLGLPELLDQRLFRPMGIEDVEWDRVASGAAFGFHGLHLTTEAVAAVGELLLRGGRWGDQQLVPRWWVELATQRHVETLPLPGWTENPDFQSGYGYQVWISRHGFFGHGAWGQYCVVVPSHELVVVVTGVAEATDVLPGVLWERLLPVLGGDEPGVDLDLQAGDPESRGDLDLEAGVALAERLRRLTLPLPAGSAEPGRSAKASIVASESSALPVGTAVVVDPVDGGWIVRLGFDVAVGHGDWRESAPLGRPVVAAGAWQGDTFVADLYVITTPHRVRLVVEAGTATATWNAVPLTGPNLELHLRAPLMTRPDVA
ncbi:serine hydrolase domain-containing protein [Kribbella sp. NPDC051770]|uniref:serine hydrolase domain-containing protein n=1 Tax=Kribbella sp. NPDC051770 TaxID=3155413 RepID=UPI0034278880